MCVCIITLVKTNAQFTIGLNELPTLLELLNFGESHTNIIQEIGVSYHDFGIKLLEDKSGSKMEAIAHDEDGVVAITRNVLTRWIKGEGIKPTSWATLATVLDECNLCQLSNKIRSVKSARHS